MKRLRHLRAGLTCSLLILVIAGTGACADDSAAGSGQNVRKYDVTELDSGNYPTAPVDIAKTRNPNEHPDEPGLIREGIRIGNSTAMAMDIDSRLVFEPHRYSKRITTPRFPPIFSDVGIGDNDFNTVAPGFMVGWYTMGQRRKDAEYGRSVVMHVMRFASPEQAGSAVRNLADRAPGEPAVIPDHPDARAAVLREKLHGRPFLSTWLAHGDIVLYVRINDPISIPFAPAPLIDFTKSALDKQLEMLKGYTPTPVEKMSALPADIDGMLSRTLPLDSKTVSRGGMDPSGVYPKQAALHTAGFPNLAQAAYNDAGVDIVSMALSTIYRTRDSAGTVRLIAALVAQQDPEMFIPLESPHHMPDTRCYTFKPGGSILNFIPVCYVAFDRYVAKVESFNLQELHQRSAAQYKLLAHGR